MTATHGGVWLTGYGWVNDPVHQSLTDDKWWFWCEDWATAEGPFEDEGLARAALARYVEKLEKNR